MRKITLLCCALLCTVFSQAQISNYSFTSSAGTYTALVAPTNVFPSGWDDNTAVSVPLGFTFTFNGVGYTSVFVHPNGYITFGSSTSGYLPISGGSAAAGVISAWGRDLQAQSTAPLGSVDYSSVGGVFTTQWSNTRRYNGTTVNAERFEMQIQLFQTTNVIKIVYGTWSNAVNAVTANLGEVGLRGASSADFKNLEVLSAGNWATPASPGAAITSTCYYNETTLATKPALGQTYTFTPPVPCVTPVSQPTLLNLTPGANSITGSFTAAAGSPSGYLVIRTATNAAPASPADGTTYTPGTSALGGVVIASGSATSFVSSGLTSSTPYYYWVYSFNNLCIGAPFYRSASPLTQSVTTNACAVSGTKTVGPTGNYASLTAAIADLNTNGIAGPVILELQPAYTSAGETFPITIPLLPCASATNTVTIRPQAGASALSITSANATGTLNLNGATYVTFDGRAGGTGTSQLTISNTSISGYAMQLINSASFNTIKYCTVSGVNTSTASGVIFFNNAVGLTTGNSNNTIDNCDIKDGATTPTNLVYCSGNTADYASQNNNNTISNSNLHDWFNATSTTAGAAINIVNGASDWTITGNSFYQSATRTFTLTTSTDQGAIFVNSPTFGTNFTITNNYIGGSAPLAGGTPLTWTGGATGTPAPRFIRFAAAFGTASTISNNTIANIAITTSSAATSQALIQHTSGNIIINNNTLGSQTATGSITFTLASTSTAPFFMPIAVGFGAVPNTIAVTNNNIGGISVSTSSTGAVSFRVIYGQPVAGSTVTISGNTIGGTGANSITQTTGGAAAGNGSLFGILMLNPTIGNVITNNTIRNMTLTNASVGPSLTGINVQSSGGSHTITGNSIYNLSVNTNNIAINNAASVVGLTMTASVIGGTNVSGNTIYNLSNTNTTVAGWVNGMYFGTAAIPQANTIISKNNVHSLSLATAVSGAGMAGIFLPNTGNARVFNNIVRLGIDAAGASLTNGLQINGIYKASSATMNIYFNSVYIGGTGVTSGTAATYAFRRSASGPADTVMNNIFYNARSNASGTGKHYAMNLNAATTLFSNYNDLLADGTGGVLGINVATDYTTLATWRTATNQDWNSISANPNFVNPVGTSTTVDLHIAAGPTPVEQAGYNITTVTDDIDAQTRSGLTPVDIGADAGNFTVTDIAPPVVYLTPLINACGTGDRVVNGIIITDATGVPVAGTLRPRIYYKKGAGAWFSQPGTLATGTATNGTWDFTIVAADMGGLVANDVVSYYIIAQDVVGTPNIASNFGGAVAANVNTVNTQPVTPNTYTVNGVSLSGNYNVGAGQTYTTLTAAVAAYNTSCISGPVTFSLTDAAYSASETFPITINANPYASATNTLTIKPTLANTTISGSSTSGIIVLNGADWVTVNGSISAVNNTICPVVTASRDLTVTNTSTSTTSAVIWLQSTAAFDGATNNSIRNINLTGSGNTQTFVGAGSGSTTISTASLGTGNNNNAFINNNISKTQYGIFSQGNSLAVKNNGTVINQNLINTVAPNNVARGGILVGFENNISISGNNISEIALASSPDVFGIAVGGVGISTSTFTGNEVTNAVITKNIIGSVRNTGTFSACGIFIAPALSGTNTITNNMISGVSANGTSGDFSVGMLIGGGAGSATQIYNNTITMTSVPANAGASDKSYALAIGGVNPVVDVRNNILTNTQNNGSGNNYAIVYGYTPFTNLTADHNDYFVAAGGTFFIGATGSLSAPANQATVANLQAATGKDGAAQNVLPLFVSATDLHLSTAAGANWCLNGSAATIAAATDDIDCQVRNNPSDIGADEFNVTGDAAATPASQTACPAAPITTITYTGTGTTFTWTRDNVATVTGIAANGTGNIAGSMVNTTAAPVTVTFTITPYNAGGCAGATFTATVLVNPTPVAVATPTSQTPCTGTPITTIVLSSATAGTTYTWTRDNTAAATGIAASGAGDISGTLTNTTAAPVIVTFTITPSANGCPGIPITATVTVNVGATITPTITEPTTCVSTDGTINIALTGATGPYTFAWTGTGVNTTAQNQTGLVAGVYDVTVTSGNGCISFATFTLNGPGGCSICPIIGSVTTNPSSTGCIGSTITLTASGLTSMGNTYGIIFKSFAAPAANPYTGGTVLATVPNGTLTAGGTTATATTSFAAAATYYIYAILTPSPLDPLCRPSATTTFVINPTPDAVAAPASQTACSGTAITTIAFSGTVAGTTYNWTRNNTATVTGIAANGAGDISGTLINTTTAPITVTFTITPIAGGCPGTPITATVLVNPTPVVITAPASQAICSGTTITTIVNSGSGVTGTVYNWTRNNTATVTGIAASGTGNISGVLVNNTAAAITVTFTITPVANGCAGTPVTATVLVNPATTATATPVSQTICSAGTLTPIVLTGVAGTTFTWTRDNTATVVGGIPASGSGSSISGFLTNLTNAPVTVTFTITPIANGCPGTPITATVLVNPLASAVATPATQTACSGSPITTIALTSNVTGTTYSWTRDNTVAATGIAASGTGNITGTLTTTGTTAVTVTFTITPSFAGCPGPSITATVTINPTPVVTQPVNQTLCNGNTTTAVTFAGGITGTTYSWTNNTTSIGLAASGTGNIAAFAATNTGIAPVTATITVIPSLNGCTGTPKTFTITVNPTANVNAVSNQTLCTGAATTAVTFTGTVAGTTYSWTNNTPSIGLAASGTGNIASFTAINTTSTTVTATITVTPTATGCPGTPRTFTITVNGQSVAPTGATASNIALCGPGTADLTVQGGALGTGASWKWYSGSCGGTLIGTGATITGVAVSGTATFYVRAEGTCNTTTCASVTVTVNPQPVITLSAAPYTSLMPPLVTGITANITPVSATNSIVWFKDGVLINGAISNTLSGITVDQLGSYSARVTTASGCTALSAPLVIKDSASNKLFILPNPNNGQFKIRYYTSTRNFGFLRTVTIYDSKGARVFTKAIPITGAYSTMDIDIRNAGKGLYIVVVGDNEGKELITGKVVVQ